MTFGNYIYQDNTSASRQLAINQLISTADKLEAGHLKAVETATKLKESIAALPFNENEEPLKQELFTKLNNAIDDNIQYGNMYYALDDILNQSGDLFSRSDVSAAIRNEATRKKFIEDLDKRADIPEMMKVFYKDKNPYNRQEIKDENGNIIGYKDWQISKAPVTHISGVEWFDRALKRTTADIKGYSSMKYFDSNGKEVNPYKGEDVSDIKFYDIFGNEIQEDIYNKLLINVLSLYKNDPTIAASINDEIEYAKWAKEHGDNTDYGIYRKNPDGSNSGIEKNLLEYLLYKFEESAQGSKYSKMISSHNPHIVNGNSVNIEDLSVDDYINLRLGNYDESTTVSEQSPIMPQTPTFRIAE